MFCLTWEIWFGSVDGQPQCERRDSGTVEGHSIQSGSSSSTLEGSVPWAYRWCVKRPTGLSGCAFCGSQSPRNAWASQPCKQPGTMRKCTLVQYSASRFVFLYIYFFFSLFPHCWCNFFPRVIHLGSNCQMLTILKIFMLEWKCWKLMKDVFFIFGDW